MVQTSPGIAELASEPESMNVESWIPCCPRDGLNEGL